MEIDLSRPPPSPMGLRVPWWLPVAVLWSGGFALIVLILWMVFPGHEARVVILETATVAPLPVIAGLLIYYRMRYGPSGVHWPVPEDRFDTSDAPRVADKEERTAYHQLRKGRISRRQYERIIAYRHFVHGEISRTEYHHIVSELDVGPTSGARVKNAQSSTSEGSSSPR